MSTRSAIIIKRSAHNFAGIYCHNNGYPSWNGRILRDHYTDLAKLTQLVKLGDISVLAENVNPPKGKKQKFDYDKQISGVVVAYARDRGETGTEFKITQTLKQMRALIEHVYAYVFDVETGEWTVYDGSGKGKPLGPVVDDARLVESREGIERFEKLKLDPSYMDNPSELARFDKIIADAKTAIADIEARRAAAVPAVQARVARKLILTMDISEEIGQAELDGHLDNREFAYIVANLATGISARVKGGR